MSLPEAHSIRRLQNNFFLASARILICHSLITDGQSNLRFIRTDSTTVSHREGLPNNPVDEIESHRAGGLFVDRISNLLPRLTFKTVHEGKYVLQRTPAQSKLNRLFRKNHLLLFVCEQYKHTFHATSASLTNSIMMQTGQSGRYASFSMKAFLNYCARDPFVLPLN
jgi:hypothetical protein